MMVLYLFMGKVLKNVVFKSVIMRFLIFYVNIKKILLLKSTPVITFLQTKTMPPYPINLCVE